MPLVAEGATMGESLIAMTGKRFGCVGVVDGKGGLVGIFTDGDLSRRMDRALLDLSIADVMTKAPKIVAPGQLAAEALALMNEKKITVLFVVEKSDRLRRPVGILHMHDCLRAGLQ